MGIRLSIFISDRVDTALAGLEPWNSASQKLQEAFTTTPGCLYPIMKGSGFSWEVAYDPSTQRLSRKILSSRNTCLQKEALPLSTPNLEKWEKWSLTMWQVAKTPSQARSRAQGTGRTLGAELEPPSHLQGQGCCSRPRSIILTKHVSKAQVKNKNQRQS